MSTFSRYLRSAQDSIDQVESDLEQVWVERLREIEEREAQLRTALLALVLLWPFDSRGRIRRRLAIDRDEIRLLRQRAERVVQDWERGLVASFSGSPDGWKSITRSASRTYFEQTRHVHIYEAAVSGQRATARMDLALLEERLTRIGHQSDGGHPGAPPQPDGPVSPAEPTGFVDLEPLAGGDNFPVIEPQPAVDDRPPTEAEIARDERMKKVVSDFDALFRDYLDESAPGAAWRKAERLLEKVGNLRQVVDNDPELMAFLAEVRDVLIDLLAGDFIGPVDDLVDLLEAALDNPEGNIEQRSRQIQEKLRDISYDSTVTRNHVIEEINGSSRPGATKYASGAGIGGGVKLNRNNMRLSIQAHGRAAFRQVVQRWAEKRRITHALLEVPSQRRAHIKPSGVLIDHVHMIRPIDEWSEIYRAEGKGRFGTGTSLMGFHHGDFAYPVPVPDSLLEAAREYSARSRGRLIASVRRRAA